MDKNNEKILIKIHQHPIVFIMKSSKGILFFVLPITLIISWIISLLWWYFLLLFIWLFIIFSTLLIRYHYFFRVSWYFFLTNFRISIDHRNGVFSKYQMSIFYENIKDIAYSKNNVLHFMLDCWTFFARSSPWSTWDFEATFIPDIESIYRYVWHIYSLPKEKRVTIHSLTDLENINTIVGKGLEKKIVIKKEKDNLMKIKWILQVVELTDEDKIFIGENEDTNNHWVFETIKRKIVLCVTHDDKFRDPDDNIVLKYWNKVIFPAISFHELKQDNVVSSSPWIKVHQYLIKKFKDPDEMDATILIGFDI